MIRRGLQIMLLVGITALGAAPSFAQVGTTNFPTYVVLQDFTNNAANGAYVTVAGLGSGAGYTFQRYEANGGAPTHWVTIWDNPSNNQYYANVHTNYPTTLTTAIWAQKAFAIAGLPASVTGFTAGGATIAGSMVFNWTVAPPYDEYEDAFPDWDSAAVKIPLGFSLAMAFWASCVAASISMKWVKDLASAAS